MGLYADTERLDKLGFKQYPPKTWDDTIYMLKKELTPDKSGMIYSTVSKTWIGDNIPKDAKSGLEPFLSELPMNNWSIDKLPSDAAILYVDSSTTFKQANAGNKAWQKWQPLKLQTYAPTIFGYGIYLPQGKPGDPSPQPHDFVNWLTGESSLFQKNLFTNTGLLPAHPKLLDALALDKDLVQYGKTGMVYLGQ